MLNQDITEEYTEAFQSLQRLNNDLFYNDLKTRMQEMFEKYEESYEKSTNALSKMDTSVSRIVFTIEDEIKNLSNEFLNNSSEAIDLSTKKVEAIFLQRIEILEKALLNFKKLQLLFKSQYDNHQKQLDEHINLQKELFESEKMERVQQQHEHYDSVLSILSKLEKELLLHFQDKMETLAGKLKDNEILIEKLRNDTQEIIGTFQTNLTELLLKLESSTIKEVNTFKTEQDDKLQSLENILKGISENTNTYRTNQDNKLQSLDNMLKNIGKEVNSVKTEQDIKIKSLENMLLEKLEDTEKAQQEFGNSIQEVAITQSHSQQQMVESQFSILSEKIKNLEQINENKHRSTFKWMIGLLAGEAVMIAIQLINHFS